ncbi:MAG: hypothetical protein E7277_04780 [Lachnospiraceae bacterium]|nr:hypothetical protein [Lachnospiraceae bacterium]
MMKKKILVTLLLLATLGTASLSTINTLLIACDSNPVICENGTNPDGDKSKPPIIIRRTNS